MDCTPSGVQFFFFREGGKQAANLAKNANNLAAIGVLVYSKLQNSTDRGIA